MKSYNILCSVGGKNETIELKCSPDRMVEEIAGCTLRKLEELGVPVAVLALVQNELAAGFSGAFSFQHEDPAVCVFVSEIIANPVAAPERRHFNTASRAPGW